MAGAYCKFCDHRCFVYRVVPGSNVTHLATCPEGMALDREKLGVDYTTAVNLMAPEDRVRELRDRADAIESSNCTGLTAAWCPVHGDCRCADPLESMSDAQCPLHAPASSHAAMALLDGEEG